MAQAESYGEAAASDREKLRERLKAVSDEAVSTMEGLMESDDFATITQTLES